MIGTLKLCAHVFPPFIKCFKFLEQLLLNHVLNSVLKALGNTTVDYFMYFKRKEKFLSQLTGNFLFLMSSYSLDVEGSEFQILRTRKKIGKSKMDLNMEVLCTGCRNKH